MSQLLKQSSAAQPLVFLLIQSADHIAGATGVTPTVTLSKAGGAFASPAGAVTEIGGGWYKVAGNATDTNTLGPLILHATGTGCDPVDLLYGVVAFNPQDGAALGLTAVPATVAGAVGSVTAGVTLAAAAQQAVARAFYKADNVVFVSPAGSNGNDGTTPATAYADPAYAAAAITGSMTNSAALVVARGVYNIGTATVNLPDGAVELIGAGMHQTTIQSQAKLATAGQGVIVKLGDGSMVRDIYVQANAARATGTFQACLGWSVLAGQTIPATSAARRVRMTADSDAVYLGAGLLDAPAAARFTGYELIGQTSYDTFNAVSKTGVAWDVAADLHDCTFRAIGPSAAAGAGAYARAVSTYTGAVRVYGGAMTAAGGGTNGTFALATERAATLEAYGVNCRTSGTSGTVYDARSNTGTNGGTILASGSLIDPAKTNGTGVTLASGVIGTPAGASLAADVATVGTAVAAVKADTASILKVAQAQD